MTEVCGSESKKRERFCVREKAEFKSEKVETHKNSSFALL